MKRFVALAAGILVVLGLAPAVAAAAEVQVDTLTDEVDDPGTGCSLREAITAADGNMSFAGCSAGDPGSDDITFLPSLFTPAGQQVIDLDNGFGDLAFSAQVRILGPGADELAIDGPANNRVFRTINDPVEIHDLTIQNGNLTEVNPAGEVGGAGIFAGSDLILDGIVLKDNSIDATQSAAGDDLYASGAGLYVDFGTEVEVISSTISGNTVAATNSANDAFGATAAGGGTYNLGGTLKITGSVIDDNDATATDNGTGNATALGGGIRSESGLDVEQSSITRNTAAATATTPSDATVRGGGVSTIGTNEIELSTIGANKVETAGVMLGGGIAFEGSTTIISSTIARNGTPATPPGLNAADGQNVRASDPWTLKNTLIADPLGPADNCDGQPGTSQGNNLEFPVQGPSPCRVTPDASDVTGDPLLATTPAFNAGTTETLALLPGSAAIDVGTNVGQAPLLLSEDQRGLLRPVDFGGIPEGMGNGSDVGAFELQKECAAQLTPGDEGPCGPSVPPGGGGAPATPAPGATGKHAAALKKCKKKEKSKKARKKCKRKKKTRK